MYTVAGVRVGERGVAPPILGQTTFSVSEQQGAGSKRSHPGDYTWWQVTQYPRARLATVTPARAVKWVREVDQETGEVTEGAVLSFTEKRAKPAKRCLECAARGRTKRKCQECQQLRRRVRRSIEEANPKSEADSKRRASGMIEKYCREHLLDHMWVLTYAGEGCHDREKVLDDMEDFGRRFAGATRSRRNPDGRPWLAVMELHKKINPETGRAHGWHVHFCIRGFMHWKKLQALWPHGTTRTPVRQGAAGGEDERSAGWFDPGEAAGYLTHYVGKDLGEGRTHLGQHRYLKAQVMRLTRRRELAVGYVGAQELAVILFGGVLPREVWESESVPDEKWTGPPVMRMDWWDPDRSGRRR